MGTGGATAAFKETRARPVPRPGSSHDLNMAPLKPALMFNPHSEGLRGEIVWDHSGDQDRSGDQASGFMKKPIHTMNRLGY